MLPDVTTQLRLPTLAEAAWVLFTAGDKAEADGLLDELVAAFGRDEAYGYTGAWVVPATLVWLANREEPVPAEFTAGGPTRWERPPTRCLEVRS